MGLAFDFTLFYMGFTLLAAIVPTASYIACLVIGAKRKLQRPCVLPTIIMVAMSLLIVLGYSSDPFRNLVMTRLIQGGDAKLFWSFLVEAVATAGLLTLFFLRKALKQEAHREWIVSWMPETPTLLTVGIASYLLIVANLCPQEGIGWPWAAYVPPSSWSFCINVLPMDDHCIVGNVFLAIGIIVGVGYLGRWWQRWLRRTGEKWNQFHLGTLCVLVMVASVLLWANVAHEGWPSRCIGGAWCAGNLAADLLVAFLPLLACWVGCEWLYIRTHVPNTEASAATSETTEASNIGLASIPAGRPCSTTANHFAWLGAALYGTGFAAASIAVWLKDWMLPEAEPTFSAQSLSVLLVGGLPLFSVIGAGSGIELCRDAIFGTPKRPAGSQEAGSQFVLTAAPILLNAVLCLVLFLGRPYLGSVLACSWLYHWHRRRQMVSGIWFPVWALSLWVWAVWSIGGSCHAPAGAVFCALPLLLAADGWLLNAICRWRRTYCIAPSSG